MKCPKILVQGDETTSDQDKTPLTLAFAIINRPWHDAKLPIGEAQPRVLPRYKAEDSCDAQTALGPGSFTWDDAPTATPPLDFDE